jgi:hypothetical protein
MAETAMIDIQEAKRILSAFERESGVRLGGIDGDGRAGIGAGDAGRGFLHCSDSRKCFLARLGEAISYEGIEGEAIDLDGIRVRVATPAMLYRMKKDTVRPQDRVDAERLPQLFGLKEY